MERFTERAIRIIQRIPPGKVMTYGVVARYAGSPRGARQVVRILHSMSDKYELPWHRVVNAKGDIGLSGQGFVTQKQLLEKEGIKFSDHSSIDLTVYLHLPDHNDDYL